MSRILLYSFLDGFNQFKWPTNFIRCPNIGDTIEAKRYQKNGYLHAVDLQVYSVLHRYDGTVLVQLHLKPGDTREWWERMKPKKQRRRL